MDVEALRAAFAAKLAEARALADEWKGKEAEMPKETAAKIDALLGQSDEVKARLDTAIRLQEGQEFLDAPKGTQAAHLGWRPAGPDEGAPAIDPKSFREVSVKTVIGSELRVRFHVPLGVQGKGYAPAFEAYLRKGMSDVGPNDRKTLSEGVDSAGGFLVPEAYQVELIKKVAAFTAIRPNARIVTTSRDLTKWPRVAYTTDDKYTSGVRLTWTGETPASATTHRVTDPVFGLLSIPVHTAMASMPLTTDLLEDSAFDVFGLSSDLIGEAFALGEDDAFINGNGVSKPKGLAFNPGGADEPNFTVSGAAAAFTADGIIALFYDVPAQYRTRGKFYLNSGSMKQVELLKDGQQRYIVSSLINSSLATPPFDNIKGKPVLLDEFMPDIAANAFPMLFGDLSGYVVLDRVGLSIQRLSEIYAETNITLLLARKRVGGQVVEPYRMRFQKMST